MASVPKVIIWYKMVALAPAIRTAFQAAGRRKRKDKGTVLLFRDLSGKSHIPLPLTFFGPECSVMAI